MTSPTTTPAPSLDSTTATLLDTHDPSDSDTDSLLQALDNDPLYATHRAARLQQLSAELSAAKQARSSYPPVTTFLSAKPLMEAVTSTPRAIVHFFSPAFPRCVVMDRHFEALADRHHEVRFLRMEAERAEWLCGKLGVRVLPCLVGFVEGVEVCRVVGFEGLGGSAEEFETGALERRLVVGELLVREKIGDGGGGRIGGKRELLDKEEDEEDSDWD